MSDCVSAMEDVQQNEDDVPEVPVSPPPCPRRSTRTRPRSRRPPPTRSPPLTAPKAMENREGAGFSRCGESRDRALTCLAVGTIRSSARPAEDQARPKSAWIDSTPEQARHHESLPARNPFPHLLQGGIEQRGFGANMQNKKELPTLTLNFETKELANIQLVAPVDSSNSKLEGPEPMPQCRFINLFDQTRQIEEMRCAGCQCWLLSAANDRLTMRRGRN